MKDRRRIALLLMALAVLGALIAGCGGDSSSTDTSAAETGSSETAEGGSELHATVLDSKVASVGDELEAVTVDLGGQKITYEKGEPLRVAFIGYGKGFDYTVPEYEAATEAAEEVGAEVTEFDPQGDFQKQISQIQSVISSGEYNALIVYPLATGLECDLLTKQAPAKGVAVVTIGYPACTGKEETPGLLTAIPDTADREAFKSWAEEIVELQGKGGDQQGILVVGPTPDPNSEWAIETAEEVFGAAGWPAPEVVETDYTQAGTLPKVQDALQRNSDAAYVAAIFPEGTAAAVTALKVAGKAGEVPVYGFGANRPSVQAIEEGNVAMSVPFYPYTNVRAAYQALALMRAGESVPPYIPYAGHEVESMRKAGQALLFVDPSNVAAYAAEVEEY